jgi:hypothetical protein
MATDEKIYAERIAHAKISLDFWWGQYAKYADANAEEMFYRAKRQLRELTEWRDARRAVPCLPIAPCYLPSTRDGVFPSPNDKFSGEPRGE